MYQYYFLNYKTQVYQISSILLFFFKACVQAVNSVFNFASKRLCIWEISVWLYIHKYCAFVLVGRIIFDTNKVYQGEIEVEEKR